MKRIKQRGFGLLEALIAMAISALVIASSFNMAVQRLQDIDDQTAAKQAREVSDAYARYAKDNFAALQVTATAAAPAVVPFAALLPNYLSANYANINSYKQSYRMHVLEPVAGRLEALVVTTGGDVIGEGRAPRIATIVGAKGGYIPVTNTARVNGSYGGWNIVNTAAYWNGANPNPGAGHLAMNITLDSNNLLDDFLYRGVVPGHPEANQMSTAIEFTVAYVAGDACNIGQIGRDVTGAILSCVNGFWRKAGSVFWEDPVATMAALNAIVCDVTIDGQSRIVQTPTVGVGPRPYTCGQVAGVYAWRALVTDDAGNMTTYGTISPNSNNFGLRTLDATGAANAVPASAAGSIEVNDVRLRSLGGVYLSQLVSKYVMKFSFIAGHGWGIPKPSCPGGSPRIIMTPQITSHGEANTTLVYAQDNGATWTALVFKYNPAPSNAITAAGSAIAQTFCYYP